MDSKLSIDLDYIKYFSLEKEEIIQELQKLKNLGIVSLVMPYEIFLNKDLSEFRLKLLEAISSVKFSLTLTASGIRNYTTTYVDEENFKTSIVYHKQFILNLYEMLKEKYNLHEGLKIIFQGGHGDSNNVAFYLEKTIVFLKHIAESVEKLGIEILIDIARENLANGKVIGDKWQDIRVLCNNIQTPNFGVRWNMKNSRINAMDSSDLLVPPDEVLSRVKVATVVNTLAYEGSRRSYNVEMQFEEIKALIKNNFKGEFNLEYIYSYIQELSIPYQNVYDSIEYLMYIITFYSNVAKKGDLVVNTDINKMKRKYIRRFFDNITVILKKNNYTFNELEISENDLGLVCEKNFDYNPGDAHKIVIKNGENMFELDTTLVSIRKAEKGYKYIFLINNVDRSTRRELCELIYLFE